MTLGTGPVKLPPGRTGKPPTRFALVVKRARNVALGSPKIGMALAGSEWFQEETLPNKAGKGRIPHPDKPEKATPQPPKNKVVLVGPPGPTTPPRTPPRTRTTTNRTTVGIVVGKPHDYYQIKVTKVSLVVARLGKIH